MSTAKLRRAEKHWWTCEEAVAAWRGFTDREVNSVRKATPSQDSASRYSTSTWGFLLSRTLRGTLWYLLPAPLVFKFLLFYDLPSFLNQLREIVRGLNKLPGDWVVTKELCRMRPWCVPHGSCLLLGPQSQVPWCAYRCHPGEPAIPPIPSIFVTCVWEDEALCLCGQVAYQHLSGGQHHSSPVARGCSPDLSYVLHLQRVTFGLVCVFNWFRNKGAL